MPAPHSETNQAEVTIAGRTERSGQVDRTAHRQRTAQIIPLTPVALERTSTLASSVRRVVAQPSRATPADQMALQRTVGNRAVSGQIQAGRARARPRGANTAARVAGSSVVQRTDRPKVKALTKKWYYTGRLEKAMKDDALSNATEAAAKLHELDATYYKTLVTHLLEKHEHNAKPWRVCVASAPKAVRNAVLTELVIKPKEIMRFRSLLYPLTDDIMVELAAHNRADFVKNVLAVFHAAGELSDMHNMISRLGMIAELGKDTEAWDQFTSEISEPRAHPKDFIDKVLVKLRDENNLAKLNDLLNVDGVVRALHAGAENEWLTFAETVLDARWVQAKAVGPAGAKRLAEHAPKAFIEKVLLPLTEKGDENSLVSAYRMLTAKGMVAALKGGGAAWTDFRKKTPMLKATARVQEKVKDLVAAPPLAIVDEIFKAFISQRDIKIGYYPASDLDSAGRIMLGESREDRKERLKKREQEMQALGQQMPSKPSTQCDTIVKLLETLIKLYPGLGEIHTYPEVEPQALLTKPMASQAGGVIPSSFEGTVYNAKGAKTGRILFTGTSKQAPASHTWLLVVAGGTSKRYDGVLGSLGDDALNNSRETEAFTWNKKKKVWEDGNGNRIREVPQEIKKKKDRGLVPPNKLGFGRAYQIVQGPLSGA